MPDYDLTQPFLDLEVADEEFVQTQPRLFSQNYLDRQGKSGERFPTAEEIRPVYERVRSLWRRNGPGLVTKGSEANLRAHFLNGVLSELGWHFLAEESLPAKRATKKTPDYCLFVRDEDRLWAAEQTDQTSVFSRAATVLEAKAGFHPLDRVSTKETKGMFPSQQIQDYLRHAKDPTGKRFFDWAILTNGRHWRLYCEQSATGAFFDFRLADKERWFCSLADFRMFYGLFRAAAFDAQDGRCRLDDLREQALLHQTTIEANLRRRIFDVLEDLTTAFYVHPANHLSEQELGAVYDNSLIFLYRLLFVLYAEGRGLLPVKQNGSGANKHYREKYSLARLVEKLRVRGSFDSDAFEELYEGLLKLFHLINGDRPEQNERCKVTRYNGGLFNHDNHPLLETWRVGDQSLANVLRQLIFAQPPARDRDRQLTISTEETIDYGTLEVRQLGDIYEGLLGGRLDVQRSADGLVRLKLNDENGKNHRHGVFYTPKWVVDYLLREALDPLLGEIEKSAPVQAALKAKTTEQLKDNSFALAVLHLNLLDPAMGSGHFLVCATEYLAKAIIDHRTTCLRTRQVVTGGADKITKDEIQKLGLIPVDSDLSQEQAELAYWRRRVVEACIYGVDINPLAVELAKLSLWLTCIAAEEPLNFLDHHLRQGNSLLFARASELRKFAGPGARADDPAFDIGDRLSFALREVIAVNVGIETTASTRMELVKRKEELWKAARLKVEPFRETADDWLAAVAGLEMNAYDYRSLALARIAPDELTPADRQRAESLRSSLHQRRQRLIEDLRPFHWELEFPDVFFNPDGTAVPPDAAGFDAVLGNPPYISTHTSEGEKWRVALGFRAGYLEDLYVHFTDLGFQLLRTGGTFGFIVSDTFFTLASKERMRDLLQSNTLLRLGQCDPFDATVDAAVFVASKRAPLPDHRLLFVQARPRRLADGTVSKPDEALPKLPVLAAASLPAETILTAPAAHVRHGEFGCLRLHLVPQALYPAAHKRVFFEPRPATLRLFERFNAPVARLVATWCSKIETSQKFTDNRAEIAAYQATLQPGDVTLVGLIAEGGQGMRTANNARFLGFLDGTPQAETIRGKREDWTKDWLASAEIAPVFAELLTKAGGNATKPTADSAAWEATVEPLRERFSAAALGFGKTDLYRIVPRGLVATTEDFQFAWKARKAELLKHWQKEPLLAAFWDQELLLEGSEKPLSDLRKAKTLGDAAFCALCQELRKWIEAQNSARGRRAIPERALGLRSSEDYRDPADAARVAVIYNGLCGHGRFVPFRKGDPEGNRWLDNEPLYIDWSRENVVWLFANSGRPESRSPVIRNAHLYFTEGITWTAVANHVAMKARFQEPCVFDADSMRLTPVPNTIHPLAFLAIMNSDFLSFFKMRFVKHTQKWEIGDLRQLPLALPTKTQGARLRRLAETAMAAKRLEFTGAAPDNELTVKVREFSDELLASGPSYLQPNAQLRLLETPADCLAVVELTVNWEVEKLYGVEGLGPFDEF